MTRKPAVEHPLATAARLMNEGWRFNHNPSDGRHRITATSPDRRIVIEATRDRRDDALRVACLLARMAHLLPL